MEKPSYFLDKSLVFREIPLFCDLNIFERRHVYDALEVFEAKPSQVIYRQGDPPDALYCIITGRVEIFIERDAREEILEHIHRGKYFGFISLLTGDPHSVSARAVNDTVLVKISKDSFNSILKNIPKLAIDLSRMLSRRLKRKDVHDKAIFESTIISVYSRESAADQVWRYAFNLAQGLKNQTAKQVILVDAAGDQERNRTILGLTTDIGFTVTKPLIRDAEVAEKIIHHASGIDILRLLPDSNNRLSAASLISVLTMLVNDYHYCLVPLTLGFGEDVFKVLAQCDLVHLLVESDIASIQRMFGEMGESGFWQDAELKKKTKLIILEEEDVHGRGPRLSRHEEESVISLPIFATLPQAGPKDPFLGGDDSRHTYGKVIRRVSRLIGEVSVGLALGSGSAMGLAHVGVLKVLEKEGIPIDIVSGSSIGAFIGALWCSGYSASEVEQIILENRGKRFLFGWDDLVFPIQGLIKGKHIEHFLKKYLGDKTFYDIQRPFKIVACDCLSMRQVVFDSGKLRDAVMASISIPGVFQPYKIASRHYIDGGITSPLPADILVEAGVKKIIAVNVLPSAEEIERTYELMLQKEKLSRFRWAWLRTADLFVRRRIREVFQPNIFGVIVSSVQSLEYLLAQLSGLSQSDIVLHPDMTAVSWAVFEQAGDLIKRGEQEAHLHLSEIKELISRSF